MVDITQVVSTEAFIAIRYAVVVRFAPSDAEENADTKCEEEDC
jgi:hypothetical protein